MKKILFLCLLVNACSEDANTTNNLNNDVNNASNDAANNQTPQPLDAELDAGPDTSTTADSDFDDADTSTSPDAADAGPDTNTADTASTPPSGDCSSDADCESSGTCVSVTGDSSGWHTCRYPILDPQGCDPDSGEFGPPECCAATQCTAQPAGACVQTPIFYCGGARPIETFSCVYDECSDQQACGEGEICLPAGTFGEPASRCVTTGCTSDDQCLNGTNGACVPFFEPCRQRFIGTHCVYDDAPCRTNADCPTGDGFGTPYCRPDGESTACDTFLPPP